MSISYAMADAVRCLGPHRRTFSTLRPSGQQPTTRSAVNLIALQRTAGNRAVTRLMTLARETQRPRVAMASERSPLGIQRCLAEGHYGCACAANRLSASQAGMRGAPTDLPILQRNPVSSEKPERPTLPDPHGTWMTEPWLCEMRQEPWGSNARLLAPGARGPSVVLLHRVLQNWLGWKWETGAPAAHTLPDWKADEFTADTRAVVRDFQKHLGMVMKDGYVGPETLDHLDGFVNGPDEERSPKIGECRKPKTDDPEEPGPENPSGCSDCDPWELDSKRPMFPWEGPARSWPRKGCDLLCVPTGPSPRPKPRRRLPKVATDSCNTVQHEIIQESHARAQRFLRKAIIASEPTLADVLPTVADSLKHWFNLDRDDASVAFENGRDYLRIRKALRSMRDPAATASYECDSLLCDVSDPIAISSVNDILLCSKWFAGDDEFRAKVLVHEWAHKWGSGVSRIFEVYEWDVDWSKLASAERVTMPDAYEGFAREMATGNR